MASIFFNVCSVSIYMYLECVCIYQHTCIALQNRCFWIMVLEKTQEPLRLHGDQPINPEGNQPWIFTGRTDAEAEASILCHLMWRADSLEKNLDAGKDWGQKEKEATKDEMVGWHQWYNRHGFEQTLGDDEGQGSLVCCSPWGCRVGHVLLIEMNW